MKKYLQKREPLDAEIMPHHRIIVTHNFEMANATYNLCPQDHPHF